MNDSYDANKPRYSKLSDLRPDYQFGIFIRDSKLHVAGKMNESSPVASILEEEKKPPVFRWANSLLLLTFFIGPS